MVSILIDRSLRYPSDRHCFSPHCHYPEYKHAHISPCANDVYDSIRKLFVQQNLDAENMDTPDWNPLGKFIRPGSKVFVLCNFVYHRRRIETHYQFASKCTHGSVLRAVLDYILIALGDTGPVYFGNAPVQSCDWNAVLKDSGAAAVQEFYRHRGLPVFAKDLRAYINKLNMWGSDVEQTNCGDSSPSREVVLSSESFFLEHDESHVGGANYRVSNYNPNETSACHLGAKHSYSVSKSILDADVIVSIPKMKTHEKVGITCCLKGFVGTVTSKNCLAHHRIGNSSLSGDEYPDGTKVRILESRYHDWIYRLQDNSRKKSFHSLLNRNIRRIMKRLRMIQAGSWHGNDTCWRMALDIATIVHYANESGILINNPQRKFLSIVDGVVGGEGDGPLSPQPVRSGTLVFSDNCALCDYTVSRLMGYDWTRLPIIKNALRAAGFPLFGENINEQAASLNGQVVNLAELVTSMGRAFAPPTGWRGHLIEER